MVTLLGNCEKQLPLLLERKFLQLPIHNNPYISAQDLTSIRAKMCYVPLKADKHNYMLVDTNLKSWFFIPKIIVKQPCQ